MPAIETKNNQKTVPDAYHGTSQKLAEVIQKGGVFIPSTGDHQYLGDGIYFFESSEWDAKEWARRKYRKTSVICAEIKLGKCLELNNKEHQDFIREKAKDLQERTGRKTLTDAFVINWITENFPNLVDTVRAFHLRYALRGAKKIFPGSRFYESTPMMICVKNLKNIIKFTITYSGV